MPANTSVKSPPEERLVNLVVALMATEQGLTKDTILTSVAGYREQTEARASKDALEKMFERDKESLRGLGIPIETIGDWADPDDLRVEVLIAFQPGRHVAHFGGADAREGGGKEEEHDVFLAGVLAQLHVREAAGSFGFEREVGGFGSNGERHGRVWFGV